MDEPLKTDWTRAVNVEKYHRFSCESMATIFEIYIDHPDSKYASQAALDAFSLLQDVEQDLSRFIENSDISILNRSDPEQPVRISSYTLECLLTAGRIYNETKGVFDPTVGCLKDSQLSNSDSGEHGMDKLLVDPENFMVWKTADIRIDLGGIGKGYAVDAMADRLKEWDILDVLIHGGSSSVYAGSGPGNETRWKLNLILPPLKNRVLQSIDISRLVLGASGLFEGQHIIDPFTLSPIHVNRAVWVKGPDAASCDALATAFMIMNLDDVKEYCKTDLQVESLIAQWNDQGEIESCFTETW